MLSRSSLNAGRALIGLGLGAMASAFKFAQTTGSGAETIPKPPLTYTSKRRFALGGMSMGFGYAMAEGPETNDGKDPFASTKLFPQPKVCDAM
jgi:hypothetical protein